MYDSLRNNIQRVFAIRFVCIYIFHPFIQLFRIPEVNCCTGDESCLWQRIRNIKMYATPKHKIYSRQRLFTVDVKLVSILQPKYETRVAKKG